MSKEDKIIKLLDDGKKMSTWMIAKNLKITTPVARYILKNMESQKKVERYNFSTRNNIVWKLI